MSTTLSEAETSFKLDFNPVPELTLDNYKGVIRGIDRFRQLNLLSYGAYVIRAGGTLLSDDCLNILGELEDDQAVIHHVQFDRASETRLHNDAGIENDATVHITRQGSADVIMLVGLTKDNYMMATGAEFFKAEIRSNRLFSTGYYSGERPVNPLRTIVNIDDVLVFDHTQLHAFKSLTADRHSYGRYYWRED